MTAALLLIRFLTEIAALVALGVWGVDALGLAGLIVPLAAAALWGVFMAPRSGRRLPDPARLVAEVVFFALAGVALIAAGHTALGIALAVIAIGAAVLVRYSGEPEPGAGPAA